MPPANPFLSELNVYYITNTVGIAGNGATDPDFLMLY